VVVLGAGNAGGAAARTAADMGAQVTVFARRREQLEAMRELGPNVTSLYPYPDAVDQALRCADILVGAVLIPGARAPHLVLRDQVMAMQPGSVIVDISVDQGGCIETTRPTNYENPTYVEHGVVHFAVTNMPGAVPRSASGALCASLMPYLLRLAEDDWRTDSVLAGAVNLDAGQLVHPAVKSSTDS
jgi:alanine dehydrogenase